MSTHEPTPLRISGQAAARRPIVTVVVPTRNRAMLLASLLDALAAQTFDITSFEVLVVDNGSTDNTRHVLAEKQRRHEPLLLRWTFFPTPSPGAARNHGIACARGEFIFFTDDDCLPEPGWIQAMVDAFTADLAIVGIEGLTYTRLPELTPFAAFAVNEGGNFATCNVAYRTILLREIGGFDHGAFPGANNEDVDLGFRMQRRGPVVFRSIARVFHPARLVGLWWTVKQVRHLVPDELCLLMRWPQSIRRYRHNACVSGTGRERLPVATEIYLTSRNPVRGWGLLRRSDVLCQQPRFYGKILAMVTLRAVYGVYVLPVALNRAWRYRTPSDPPPLMHLDVTPSSSA